MAAEYMIYQYRAKVIAQHSPGNRRLSACYHGDLASALEAIRRGKAMGGLTVLRTPYLELSWRGHGQTKKQAAALLAEYGA